MYNSNIVTNKDGQIQTLRDQIQHLSFRSAEKLADQKVEAMKLQVTSEARMQLSAVENKARLEVDQLRSHLNREETAASNLRSECFRSQRRESRRAGLYRSGGGAS